MLIPSISLPIDIYGTTLSMSDITKKRFTALKYRIDQEVLFQKEAFKLLGSLDTILTAATATQRHSAAVLGDGRMKQVAPVQGATLEAGYKGGVPTLSSDLGVRELEQRTTESDSLQ